VTNAERYAAVEFDLQRAFNLGLPAAARVEAVGGVRQAMEELARELEGEAPPTPKL